MPSRPSLAANPDGWERSWQQELDKKFPSYRTRMPSLISDFRPVAARMMTQNSFQETSARHRELCRLQCDIAHLASDNCATEDFEGEWERCGETVRTQHYFEAMRRLMSIPDMEDQRGFSPEITLKNIQTENGKGYTKLLRQLMPAQLPDRETIDRYIWIQNPLIESMLEVKDPESFDTRNNIPTDPFVYVQRSFIINRTTFMSLVIWNILLSFYGRSETNVPLKATSHSKMDPIDRQNFQKMGLSKEEIRSTEKEVKQNRKQGEYACFCCRKFEVQFGGKLKSCAKCSSVGRSVHYCSRECQVKDWKLGNPPHKSVCGKSPKEVIDAASIPSPDPSQSATTPDSSSIEPPDPSYRRSPALLHLISMLEENPGLDYVLMRPSPHPDHGVSFADPMGSLFFNLSRRRAFNSGEEASVRRMYEQLKTMAKDVEGYGVKGLQKQFLKEYGIDVTTPMKGGANPISEAETAADLEKLTT